MVSSCAFVIVTANSLTKHDSVLTYTFGPYILHCRHRQDIGEQRAYEKACQALREGAPDVRRQLAAKEVAAAALALDGMGWYHNSSEARDEDGARGDGVCGKDDFDRE